MANDTLDFVPLPIGRKPIRCKWDYRIKYGPNGIFDQLKPYLVAKGFS